jgi:hypothetical protein
LGNGAANARPSASFSVFPIPDLPSIQKMRGFTDCQKAENRIFAGNCRKKGGLVERWNRPWFRETRAGVNLDFKASKPLKEKFKN